MEDLRIRKLVLNKVGVFKHLDVSFPEGPTKDKAEIHIFVGENGTGKTTLLEAMTFYRIRPMADYASAAHIPESLDSENSYLFSKIDFKQNPHPIQIQFANGWTCKQAQIPEDQLLPSFPFTDYLKNYYAWPKPLSPVPYAFFAANGYRRFENPIAKSFFGSSLENPFYLSLAFESKHTETEIPNWIANRLAQANQAQLAGNEEETQKYHRHIGVVENAVSEIIQRKIKFRVDFIKGLVECLLDGKPIHLGALASGHQAILNFLLDLMYRLEYMSDGNLSHFTLFLDEIDIHLHPKAQRRILPVIQKLFPNAQIFITTHSPFVVGSVDDAWVYKFKLDEDGNSVLDGVPTRSEDARSYRTILEEVFDIREEFGIDAQSQLDKFYQLRQEVLKGSTDAKWTAFNKLGMELASQSPEMHSYVSLELRQAARILNRQLIH